MQEGQEGAGLECLSRLRRAGPDDGKGAHHLRAAAVLGVRPDGTQLAELSRLAESGELTTRVAAQLPLERTAEAHQRLAADGQLVLIP
jgi:NADPH:quinone reductase-like Zn-dependent oxidoreductase